MMNYSSEIKSYDWTDLHDHVRYIRVAINGNDYDVQEMEVHLISGWTLRRLSLDFYMLLAGVSDNF